MKLSKRPQWKWQADSEYFFSIEENTMFLCHGCITTFEVALKGFDSTVKKDNAGV